MTLSAIVTVFAYLLSLSSAFHLNSGLGFGLGPLQAPKQAQNILNTVLPAPQIRNATIDDLDDLTDVLIDAFSASPVYDYVFQFRNQYPKFHWECRRRELELLFTDRGEDTIVNVIDVPSESKPGRERRVVALAIWELLTRDDDDDDRHRRSDLGLLGSFLTSSSNRPSSSSSSISSSGFNCLDRIDVNYTRAIDYIVKLHGIEDKYVNKAYDRQVYLSGLATHPDYDGNGFGAAHCHWGMELAKRRGEVTSLVATPAGYPLYNSLGFESVANVTVDRIDGGILTWMEAMVYKQGTE